jgi:transposase
VTATWAAVRVKDTYLHAQFLRLRARRGAKKAILAVAASMLLTAIWHMLKNGVEYRDLGADHFSRRSHLQQIHRLVRRSTISVVTSTSPLKPLETHLDMLTSSAS